MTREVVTMVTRQSEVACGHNRSPPGSRTSPSTSHLEVTFDGAPNDSLSIDQPDLRNDFRCDAPPSLTRGAAEVSVNRRSVVLLLSFACLSLSGETIPGVSVRKPSVFLVLPSQLRDVCRTSAKVEACTAFVGQVLTCSCELTGTEWRIRARAQFIPMMYVTNTKHLAHERDHIRDIERATITYVQQLALRAFDSRASCTAAAAHETAQFPRLMNRFKDDSNATRHPGYQRVFTLSRNPVIR